MQPTPSMIDVIAVLGDPRHWDATWQYHQSVPAEAVRVHGDLAWVDLPTGTWYAAVLAGPAPSTAAAGGEPWVLLLDDTPTSVDVVPAWHPRLLATGWQPVPAQVRTSVPVPARLVHVTLAQPAAARVADSGDSAVAPHAGREQWYRSRVWLPATAAPLQHLHLHDATGALLPVVCLEMTAPSPETPAGLTAVLDVTDPQAADARAAVAGGSAWQPMPTPPGAHEEPWVTRRGLAPAVYTQVAHLLGAPVIVGVQVDPLEALADFPGWAVQLPGDLVDEIVAVLWAAGRDDLLPHDTP